ncbi:MAG: flagellar M-ring protein FliF [Zoogloea sp.]|nr:flagellar M-ring protein FliF [Zoogloea sp.]
MAAEAAAAPAPSPLQQVLENIRKLSQRQKIAGAVALALGIALIVGVLLWSRQPDYVVLFSNLSEKDGGTVVTSLQQQNVPYKFSEGGGAILVPSTMVHDLRLRLAAQGIPKGGSVGFELLENQKLGLSQFNEQINYQRALEGELARTIQSISSVAGARVHLAIPKQTAFLRDEQKPTASVLVNLHPGRSLEPAQVAGIVHLVASSVPQLANENVSIIDQNGNLLTQMNNPLRMAGLDPTQLSYVKELEGSYAQRIDTILTPLLGEGNFRAQVTADVDFNQTEQTAETYRPNPAPEQAIRSQQSNETTTREAQASGVPGALTNQPPVPATAPLTTPPVAGAAGGQNSQPPTSATKSGTTNYELDKTIEHVKKSLGQVKRLSVAVLVNHKVERDKDGKPKTTPLTDAELQRIENLVREAVGYNKDRGDTLNVASSPFVAAEKEAPPETPFWKDPDNVSLGKDLIKYLVIAGVLAFVAFGIVRPLLKTVMPPEEAEEEDEEEGEEGDGTHATRHHAAGSDEEGEVAISPEAAARMAFEEKLEKAHQLAKENPKLLANLIKEWMGVNEQR